jgi:hypothetical protein
LKNIIIAALCIAAPAIAIAKGQFDVYTRQGILMNKKDADYWSITPYRFTRVKNTWTQALAARYSLYTKFGLIVAGGLEVGYERYSIDLFTAPPVITGFSFVNKPKDYKLRSTIPYGDVNIELGWRFKVTKKFWPELRVGQTLHMPMRSTEVYRNINEYPFNYHGYYETVARGGFGNSARHLPIGELLNSITLAADVWHSNKTIKSVKLGVQYRLQYIMASGANRVDVTYYNTGYPVAQDKFDGKHRTLSLLIGVGF